MTAPWQGRLKPKTAPDPISAEVRALVRNRSNGRCELCGQPGQHLHHRQLRRGGDHSASNIVNTCLTDHRRIHGHVSWSLENGWLVSQYASPASTPLHLPSGPVLLSADGTLTPWKESA